MTPSPASSASALSRAVDAWCDFWFRPQDPTLLGLIRILVGAVTLYTFAVHSLTLQEFMGANAWCDVEFRRQVAADRPILVGALDTSPLVAGESAGPAPSDEQQRRWAEEYKSVFDAYPPAPHPINKEQHDFAMRFRGNNPFDFRFFGLPFPKNDREVAILDAYVKRYGQTFPPPYPANDAEIKKIEDYMNRHGADPRRLYARGTPIFSVWLEVVEPRWMNAIQAAFVATAVAFVLGFGTRISSAVVWFANLCYIHRNPHILFGVDTMMNVLLLYLMVGPCGAALSIDRVISRWWSGAKSRFFPGSPPAHYSPVPEPSAAANVSLRLMQIHLCVIYFIAGISKLQGVSWWNGTAVWSVLGNYEFAPMNLPIYNDALRLLGRNQAVFETCIAGAGFFTLAFEITYPFLVWKPRTRWLLLAGAIFLHGFIGLFMGLKTFSLLMLIFNMAFLRPEEVRWIFASRSSGSRPAAPAPPPESAPATPPPVQRPAPSDAITAS